MLAGLKHRIADRSGATALMFAASAMAVVLTIGTAVDLGRTVKLRSEAQEALDAATLAMAQDPTLTTAAAKAYFTQNLSSEATVTGPTITVKTDGTVVGTVTVESSSTFLGIMGIPKLTVSASTTAQQKKEVKYSSVTMKTTAGSGAFDKEIYFVTYDDKGAVLTKQLMLSYDYTWKSSGGTKTYSPALGATTTVNVTSYDKAAIEMVVYEDLTYKGSKVNPKTLKSTAANASTFIQTSGTCNGTGGQTMAWEDGGDSNFADFKNTMTCTTVANSYDVVRIAK